MLAPTLFDHGTEEQLDRGSCRKWPAAKRSGRRPGRSRSPAATWLRCGPPPRRPTAAGCSTARRSGAPCAVRGPGASGCSAPTRSAQRHRGLTYLHVRPEGRRRDGAPDRAARRRARVSARSSSTTSSSRRRRASARSGDGWRAAMSTAEQRARDVAAQPRAGSVAAGASGWSTAWQDRGSRPGLRRPGGRRLDQGPGLPAAHLRARSPGSPTAASWAPSRRSPRCSGPSSTSPCTRPPWTCAARTRELADSWTDGLLFALGGPIYAGTNEIQRNIIAERLLGLPKERE